MNITISLDQKVITHLIETAERSVRAEDWDDPEDDFNPYEVYGGNFDDAYWGGNNHGETEMARYILNKAGIDYIKPDQL